jgi:hypothetical protein
MKQHWLVDVSLPVVLYKDVLERKTTKRAVGFLAGQPIQHCYQSMSKNHSVK